MSQPDNSKSKSSAPSKVTVRTRSRKSTSVLFPVVLIAAGVMLLLSMLDMLPDLNWEAAVSLWPLVLIFIGLDLILRLLPRPFGTIASFFLAVSMMVFFVAILLFPGDIPLVKEFGLGSIQEAARKQISFPADGVEEAEVRLNLSSRSTTVSSLAGDENLIEADVSYIGELIFDTYRENGLATVELDTRESNEWLYWLNPANWFDQDQGSRWLIGLSKEIPTDLDLDMGSGSGGFNLQDLTLSALAVDGSSGSMDLALPGGDYDMSLDSGSGAATIILPDDGQHHFVVNSGSGSLSFLLPKSMEMMVVVKDKGSGGLHFDDAIFSKSAGSESGEGTWITSGYKDGKNSLELILDSGSGSVSFGSAP